MMSALPSSQARLKGSNLSLGKRSLNAYGVFVQANGLPCSVFGNRLALPRGAHAVRGDAGIQFAPTGVALDCSRRGIRDSLPQRRCANTQAVDEKPEDDHANHPRNFALAPLRGLLHFVPFFPVYGLTLPFVLKLSAFELLGDDRTCGATYVPDFVTYPETREAFAKEETGSSNRASKTSMRIARKQSIPARAPPVHARSAESD